MYGACDCGVDYSKESDREKVFKFRQANIPKDLYMWKDSGELFEGARDLEWKGPNTFYVGMIDPDLDVGAAIELMNALESFMNLHTPSLSEHDKLGYLNGFGSDLTKCLGGPGVDKKHSVELINAIFTKRYQRVTSDWVNIYVQQ